MYNCAFLKARSLILLTLLIISQTQVYSAEFDPISRNDFYYQGNPSSEKFELGRLLFFDKILSGNKNISCATCHHPKTFSGDALSLPVGEGGEGLGIDRNVGFGVNRIHERVPRNSPALFNLAAKEYIHMFVDGRVSIDPTHPSGFISPAGDQLPQGLDNILAAQAMFPVTSFAEMAGQKGENAIADASARNDFSGENGVWNLIAERIQAIPEYVDLFKQAYKNIQNKTDISYVHIANAIAAFEAKAFLAINSPFDQYLKGNYSAMTKEAHTGRKLFYGKGRCFECHSGVLQTNHNFHVAGMPQIGPGKGDGFQGREDFGRARVTKKIKDLYRFKTPTLRNVMVTGPWGHNGGYADMETTIFHHVDPYYCLSNFQEEKTVLPWDREFSLIDFFIMRTPTLNEKIIKRIELPKVDLSKAERAMIISFLHALTDKASIDLEYLTPKEVPSGLPVKD